MVEKISSGIYYISKEIFPVQLILNNHELPAEEHLWLRGLSKKLSPSPLLEAIEQDYVKARGSNLQHAVMDVIVNANPHLFQGGTNSMVCQALRELWSDDLAAAEDKGESRLSTLIQRLINENQIDDIKKVTSDSDYRQEMYRRYQI